MCDPILETLLKMQPQPIIVNPVVKMRPHSAAHPHFLITRGYPRNVLSFSPDENRNRKKQKNNGSRQIEDYKGFLLLTDASQLKATHEVHAKKKTESN